MPKRREGYRESLEGGGRARRWWWMGGLVVI